MKKSLSKELSIGLLIFVLYAISQNILPIIVPKENESFAMTASIIGYVCTFIAAIILSKKFDLKLYSGRFEKKHILYVVGSFALIVVFNLVSLLIFKKPTESENQMALQEMASESLWSTIGYTVIIAPIVEELVFRGSIMGLIFKKSKWIGFAVSVILFTIIHSPTDLESVYRYATMGIVFSGVYMTTKNLKVSTASHIFNNMIASINLL
ncbi:CPBP family intramembrane glutamic endopeptidase [Peptostreptococcus faecalis]|uniref:CPBP family intramembrane glutamic endopeptidase n=1 Tax=Peptostreptococcus faecalis TaxID=2045015 RepID=UPI000C7966D6|nr:type II CAAX endopeptidase family protein [Peptostreptococcus faecalis]